MLRANTQDRVLRALCAGVLATFVFGSTSGPLRTCLNHPSHATGEHGGEHSATSHAAEHGAHGGLAGTRPSDHAPASDHEGCSCLGRCSPEPDPGLPATAGPAPVHGPWAPKAILAAATRPFEGQAPFDLPLARPPPAVV